MDRDVLSANVSNVRETQEETMSWTAWGSWAASAVTSVAENVSKQANDIAEQSINVLSEASEYMQKDLEEFTNIIKEDASAVYTTVAKKSYETLNTYAGEEMTQEAVNISNVATSMLGTGIRTIVDNVEKILLEDSEDEIEDAKESIKQELCPNEVAYEINAKTYTEDPTDPSFFAWKAEFIENIENRKNKLTDILIARTNVRLMFNRLVPKSVNHNDFWARYLFVLEKAGLVPETKHVESHEENLDIEECTSSLEPIEHREIENDVEIIENPNAKSVSDPEVISVPKCTDENAESSIESDIDDWEKDLDIDGLDITEEEMTKALKEVDDEDWDLDDV